MENQSKSVVVHQVIWLGVYRGSNNDPREIGYCEKCKREVYDRDGLHTILESTKNECISCGYCPCMCDQQ
jgi:hypothetical protein